MADVTSEQTYPAYFAESVRRGAQALLTSLQGLGEALPGEDLRQLAFHVLDFALDLDEAWPVVRQLCLRLAPKAEQAGHRDDWLPFLRRAVVCSQQHRDQEAEASLRYNLGMLHELRTRFDAACAEFEASASLCATLRDARGEARALNRHAYVARLQGRYEEAEHLVQQALALLPANAPEEADCAFTLGVIAYDRYQWADAVVHLQRSLSLREHQPDKHRIALSLRNLGPALHRLKRYDEAIQCYERALALFEEAPDPVQQAITRMNFGIVCSLTGDSQRALTLYRQAEPIFRRVQDDLRLAMIYTNTAIEYRKMNAWDEAEQCCLWAIQAWQALNNPRSTVNAMDELGLVYRDQERYHQAIAVFEDALAHLDAITDPSVSAPLRTMVCQHLDDAQTRLRQKQGQESR